MAKDRSTSAREFLFADNGHESSHPRLSDWLINDLKGARRSSVPPPPEPLESGVETTAAGHAEQEPQATDVAAPHAEPAAEVPPERESAAAAEPALGASPELDESRELAESLSYAREEEAPEETPAAEDAQAPDAEPSATEAPKIYADPEDWLEDDRDSETTAAFFTPHTVTGDLDEAAADADVAAAEGTSLSPQVLAPEEEDEDRGAVVVVPGLSGGRWWTIAAALGVALLLLFVMFHRTKKSPSVTSTASEAAAAPLSAPAANPNADSPPASGEMASDEDATQARASGVGHARASSDATESSPSDPAMPGGPSVARFPDLPREILMQLEQAFEADARQRAKGATDSVERY